MSCDITNMNYRALTLLGYALGIIMSDKKDQAQVDWLIKAVENVVYLGKGLPEGMP